MVKHFKLSSNDKGGEDGSSVPTAGQMLTCHRQSAQQHPDVSASRWLKLKHVKLSELDQLQIVRLRVTDLQLRDDAAVNLQTNSSRSRSPSACRHGDVFKGHFQPDSTCCCSSVGPLYVTITTVCFCYFDLWPTVSASVWIISATVSTDEPQVFMRLWSLWWSLDNICCWFMDKKVTFA